MQGSFVHLNTYLQHIFRSVDLYREAEYFFFPNNFGIAGMFFQTLTEKYLLKGDL